MGRTGVWGHNMINKKRQKEFKQFNYKKRRIHKKRDMKRRIRRE